MARKTFHHLQVGDVVTLEHYRWTGDTSETDVLEEAQGVVVRVLSRRVEIRFQMRMWKQDVPWDQQRTYETIHHFSRQGGQRWGAEEDDYRIKKTHSRRKET